MLNKVMLIGHLGDDPDVKRTNDGRPIATFSVATSERWKDKQTGERHERTEWHRVVVFNENLCNIVEKYLHKGSKVYVEGQIQSRKWQDQDGNARQSTRVVLQGFGANIRMLDGKDEGGGGRGEHDENPSGRKPQSEEDTPRGEGPDDDLPF